jgi:hypothetical protein
VSDSRFPPVGLLSPLEAVDAPQFLPGSPHNLPPRRDRPAQRQYMSGATLMELPPSGVPTGGIAPSPVIEPTDIFDPHHYASVNEGNIAVPNGSSIQVLLEPSTRRNYLMLRNSSAAANIYVSFARDASLNSPLRITPGTMILFDVVVPQDDMYAYADAAAGTLVYGFSTI